MALPTTSPAKISVNLRSSSPGMPPSRLRPSARDSDGKYSASLQQVQSKLHAISAEHAEHREEVEAALSRLSSQVQSELGSTERDALRHAVLRVEDLEVKVTRASELSCDVYDQQVEYQTQCDKHFSAMRQALGEHRTLTDTAHAELKATQEAACSRLTSDLCSALTVLRPEVPQLCRGFQPEEASCGSGILGSGEWLDSTVKHADLVAFAYNLLRRLKELLEAGPSDSEATRYASEVSSRFSRVDLTIPAAAGADAHVHASSSSSVLPAHALDELQQAQKRACSEVMEAAKSASQDACQEIRREVLSRLRTVHSEQNPGIFLDARYDELLAATSRASAEVAATAGEASARLASSVLQSQVQLERQLKAEAAVLARNVEASQKTWFESVSTEMVDSLTQQHAQFEARLRLPLEEEQLRACDEGAAKGLSEGLAENKAELSELHTMVGGTRRRICETSRSVAQLNDEVHATVVAVQKLQSQYDGKEVSTPQIDLAKLRADIVAELSSDLSEEGQQRSSGPSGQQTLEATREARRDLEVLRDEIKKRLHEEQHVWEAVQGACKSVKHSEADVRMLVLEERRQRVSAMDALRKELAGSYQLNYSDGDARQASAQSRSDISSEFINATEALQAVGMEMCESQVKSRQAARLEAERVTAALELQQACLVRDVGGLTSRANLEAASMKFMKEEITQAHYAQQSLASTVRDVLVECDARMASWFGETQQQQQHASSSSGPQRMDIDTVEQVQSGRRQVAFAVATATPVTEQLRGAFAELGRGFGDLREAATVAPQLAVAAQSVPSSNPAGTSASINPGTMSTSSSAVLHPAPGSPRHSVPTLVLPTSGRAPSPAPALPFSVATSSTSGLRQSSPSSLAGSLHGAAAIRQPSPTALGTLGAAPPPTAAAPARARHSSPAHPVAGPYRQTMPARKSETPLCAWNGGVQGSAPRTPRDAPTWPSH